jgi:hypothetical protein
VRSSVYFLYRGRRHEINSPIVKLFGFLLVVALLIPTLPLHFITWMCDHEGFLKGPSGNRDYSPTGLELLFGYLFDIAIILLVVLGVR